MSEIRPADLFGRLNKLGYRAMEGAATFCKLRGNPRVELIHFLYQVLNESDSDFHRIIQRFELNPGRIATQLTASLDRLPAGATGISGFAQALREAVEQGFVYGSLMYKQGQVRTGHMLVGILKNPNMQSFLYGICREFEGVKVDTLTDEFEKITNGSPEDAMVETAGGGAVPGETSQAVSPQGGKGSALAQYAIDLTARAREGKIDPIFGRDEEIRQIIDILMRRRQNNPILTGEAGVGKTAVVEGFALRIVAGDVPPSLRGVSLRTLDLGLLQAGASMKGEFENRLRSVIDEVQASPEPIILFIDEAHQLIGAGGSAGQGDAANLLKPALARGTLRTIAATTWAEYKKYFEKDPALVRRFQTIKIDEPDEDKAVAMIRGLATNLEQHHKVLLLDEALEAAVKLSKRYIPTRQLPDKAVSLIDTAAARVAVSQHATPARLEDVRRSIETSEIELGILKREARSGSDHGLRLGGVDARLAGFREELAALEERWEKEKTLVTTILDLRMQLSLETGAEDVEDARAAQLVKLRELEAELHAMQGESPLIYPVVDGQAVASVVADWTGVPVGRMMQDEVRTILTLADHLEKRVVGQRHALELIAKRIEGARAGLVDPNKPIGVFMLAGTSGVGKTETALALAELLYGGEQNLITINMSEFQEAHTVSTLKGAPPGYVGYGEGGKLTEAVRRKPYSVVLLDEVEKAHTDVHEIFFQVFDKGRMEDGEGRPIDFRNTIIILTTNAGTEMIMNLCKDPDLMPETEALGKALREPLLKVFPPALLGRLDVIPFFPLTDEVLRLVIRLQLRRLTKRMTENRGITLVLEDSVEDLIASRCNEIESGGRIVQSIINQTLLPDLSRIVLTAVSEGTQLETITVAAKDGAFAYTPA